jgi:RNA polymerase sigma-70 factor (ECF subfamily)
MYAELTDTDLLLLSKERPDAFGEFYQRHAETLLRFFARRTFDLEGAADLTAETFAEAFASRTRFHDMGAEGSAAASWLYGIGRHQLSRFFRAGGVEDRARKRLGMPARELAQEDFERIEELADLESLRRAVADALQALSEDQREATRLRVVEGRTYEEVAAALGCTQDTARARVSRGLRRLAEELEPRAHELVAEVD